MVPDVNAEHLALTDTSPAVFICHSPGAVAVVASVRVPPTGTTATATQVAPSTVPSKVTVAVNVPVICQASAPTSECKGTTTQVVAAHAAEYTAVKDPVDVKAITEGVAAPNASAVSASTKNIPMQNCFFMSFLLSLVG
jgi:hypothetical protein